MLYPHSMQYASYHDLLSDEFSKRRIKNSSYSLRAYARDLGLTASRLSLVLKKKQGLSVEIAQTVAGKLKLDESKSSWFCFSVGENHSRSDAERKDFKKRITEIKHEATIHTELMLEYFKVISDWYHFAILEMTYMEGFKNSPDWMAEMLGISVTEVTEAIARLKSLDLIKEENGSLKDTFKFLATPSDVPSEALKNLNTQVMEKGIKALRTQAVDKREISTNIFSVDSEQMPVFKEKIRNFRRELEFEASKAQRKDSVYCLGMQFFNLTEKE